MATLNMQHIEKLNESNYEVWKLQMRSVLVYNELWPYTSGTILKTEENSAVWTAKDEKALALILLSVSQNQLNHIKRCTNSHDAWESLKRVHESKGPVRKAALYKQLYRMRKEANVTMTQYVNDFSNKAEQLEEVGIQIPSDLLSIMLLSSLPAEFENFCVAIESRDELPNLENLKIKLIEEDARKGENDIEYSCSTGKNDALFTKSKYNNKNHVNLKQNYKNGKFNGNCNNCKRYGHRASDCRFKDKRAIAHKVSEEAMTATALSIQSRSNIWCLDSGASMHMCNNKNKFQNLDETDRSRIYTAAEHSVESTGKGNIKMKINASNADIKLKEALLVPGFKNNLLSVSSITKNGYKVIFYENNAIVKRSDGRTVMNAKMQDGLYIVEESRSQSALLTSNNNSNLLKWHHRLGHLNFNDVKRLKNNDMVMGMNDNINVVNPQCETCYKSKIHQLPYKNSTTVENEILGLVHSDICGPFSVPSLGGAKYFATFIDDKSRYTEIAILKNKSDIFEAFKVYKARVEKATGKYIKKLRTDNAKEYLSNQFTNFLKEEGITRELSVEYTPQQNGLAERANRSLVEMARSMLLQAKLPLSLWAEAINTAAYIRNRCPTKALNNMTPFQAWTGKKPYIGFMRTFGSRVIALEKGPRKNKFVAKGKEYILVGYSHEAKAYRLWEQNTRSIVKRRDVRFIENIEEPIQQQEENEIETLEIPLDQPSRQLTNNNQAAIEEEESSEEKDEGTSVENDTIENPTNEEIQITENTPIRRAAGRPKIEKTGKRGRPRKLYQSANIVYDGSYSVPNNIKEVMDSPQKEL